MDRRDLIKKLIDIHKEISKEDSTEFFATNSVLCVLIASLHGRTESLLAHAVTESFTKPMLNRQESIQ